MQNETELLHWAARWLREALAWIALALAGGTLFALKRGAPTIRAWVGVLIKSVIVGFIAARVIMDTTWSEGWQWVAVALVAFGADAILLMADELWQKLASNPVGVARAVLGWTRKRIVIQARPTDDGRGGKREEEKD